MEIGYAYARRKPIYVLAPMPDLFLMPLVTAVVSIEALLQLVQACMAARVAFTNPRRGRCEASTMRARYLLKVCPL